MTLKETLNRICKMNTPTNEQATITKIIVPVLRDLGWDVYDDTGREEVKPEYWVGGRKEGGKVDIALFKDNRCVCVVEAKRPGVNLIKHVDQVLRYAYYEGVTFCALTDGLEWRLYLPREEGRPEEREFAVLRLKENTIEQSENDLKRFLSRETVLSGDAKRDAVRQLKQVAKIKVETATPSQPTYSSKPANTGVSREVDERPTGYTIFGDFKPWRSGIGIWIDVVEQVYSRHEYDFLARAERLRLTPGSRRVLISGNLQSINRYKRTRVPGIYVEYSLTQAECVKLAYQLLEMFGHPPSDLQIQSMHHQAATALNYPTYSSKPTVSGVSKEVDQRPIGYTLFGVRKPWWSGIGMWADVVEEVYSRHENDFLKRAQKLRLSRSNPFLKDGVLISDDSEKINRPRGPIKPSRTSIPLYIERSLKVDVLIELAYELLKMFDHPDSDLVFHWD